MEKAILQKSFDARLEVKSEAEDGKLHIKVLDLCKGSICGEFTYLPRKKTRKSRKK